LPPKDHRLWFEAIVKHSALPKTKLKVTQKQVTWQEMAERISTIMDN
jgi:hypothetical protein